MAEGDHTINIREVLQSLGREPFRDLVDHGGRTVDGRQNADEIARADLAVGPHITLEGGALRFRQHVHRLEFTGMGIVAVEFAKLGVVAVNHGAGFNVYICKAYRHAVFQDRLSLEDFPGGDLVAGGHLAAAGEVFSRHHRSYGHILAGNHDVVVGVKADDRTHDAFFRHFNHGDSPS